MLLNREELPSEGEIVLCTVKAIKKQSVFVRLDEYKSKDAVISISEVSPGRIRNIRNYVQIGKKIFCKVLRVDKKRHQIDVSLRRVNQREKINKNAELRRENLAETILSLASREFDLDLKDLYYNKFKPVLNDYYYLHGFFEEIVAGESSFEDYTIEVDSKVKDYILDLVSKRLKKPTIEIKYVLRISSDASNGLEAIKKPILEHINDFEGLEVHYLGGGKYLAKLTGEDSKHEDNKMKNFIEKISEEYENTSVEISYEKKE